ncbi:uncharacterized protein LOC128810209 isoform X3 [Vidua macroura]|uniref:uncharacterized protein LOC128810209 isoform X3 n=1 Tax=Vidua macroura TaxID=187451 RepID=UPI0023A7C7D8|nr:uncharacterized protein LOC128810209 isoform X3 [Vidua macroura]
MAEERGAELGAAPERRREPVCRQRRSERSAARRGRWQPSWGAATAPRRGGAAAEGGGARGSGVCRRGGGGGRLHAQAPRAKLAAGGETGLACTERARLHGGGGRQQQRGGSGVRRGCGGGTRGPPPRAGHRTLRDAERRSGAIPAIPGEAARIHSQRKSTFRSEDNSQDRHLFHRDRWCFSRADAGHTNLKHDSKEVPSARFIL